MRELEQPLKTLHKRSMSIISGYFLYRTNVKTQLARKMYTGQSCSFLTSNAIMGVQMGDVRATADMWADSLCFLYVVFSSGSETGMGRTEEHSSESKSELPTSEMRS
jgi:hypothetical protein